MRQILIIEYNTCDMSAHELGTAINIFQDNLKNYIEVVPPVEEFELEALEWTGAGERLFAETSDSANKTTLWTWRVRDEEGLITPQTREELGVGELEKFTTRAFAHQVSLLRKIKGHKVNISDNL